MSRPKIQDSPPKPKTAGPAYESRSQSTITPCKSNEKAVAEISMKDFLDFLKISYQVNQAIDNPSLDTTEKGCVDWKKLTSDTLINRLKERETLLYSQKIENIDPGSFNKRNNGISIEKTHLNNNDAQNNKNISRRNSEEKLEKKSLSEKATENLSNESSSSVVFTDHKKSGKLLRKKSIKKEGSGDSETSRSFDSTDEKTPSTQLKKRLNEVLQEGILDSVLPYLLPKIHNASQENSQSATKKPFACEVRNAGAENSGKTKKVPIAFLPKEKSELRKKFNEELPDKNDKKDTEVIIHVCDEIKNLKRDFKCSQKLLLDQMGYFAEVTSGQKLEDMDISVHCDVVIFDWLMKWVQKDSLGEENWPILDPTIAIPVLMSSAFLQMRSLHEYCLQYCKTYINDIVRESPNLGCLNDNVLTRFANLFSNTDVENIVDKKDKIQSKLFCKLIVSLTEPDPQPSRGHFSSLATIYRCSKCLKLILKNMSNLVSCVATNMKMDPYGSIYSTHVYDFTWNLSDYVKDLKLTLKSWRKVYWRLWADCHLLYCQVCEEYFPAGHMTWCRFHLENVQYFPLENQRSVFHCIGRYPCCGERVYRFEVVKKNFGCQYRDHIVTPKNTNETEILKLWNVHKDVIKSDPPNVNDAEILKFFRASADEDKSIKSPVKVGFWWEGLEIVPTKQFSGVLSKVWDAVIKKDDSKTVIGNNSENKNLKSPVTKTVTSQQCNTQEMSSLSDSSDDSNSSSNAENSEESYHHSKVVTKPKNSNLYCLYGSSNRWSLVKKERKRRKRKRKKSSTAKNEGSRFWLSKLSTRCNQDNQREFEERALRQIESILAKKLSGENFLERKTVGNRNNCQAVPLGGIYVKLEQEWREAHCFSHGCPGSSIKARGSGSHVNINNCGFPVHKRSKSRGHR